MSNERIGTIGEIQRHSEKWNRSEGKEGLGQANQGHGKDNKVLTLNHRK